MACFIRDVRKDLAAPKMPFVIGVIGVGGDQANTETNHLRQAMAAPASMPEFKNNVAAVETAPFWSAELAAIAEKNEKVQQMRSALDNKQKDQANADGKMTPGQIEEYMKKYEADLISPAELAKWKSGASNFGFHYLGCAKTFALMGKAFAQANLKLIKQP
jgi:alpha-galactosidase